MTESDRSSSQITRPVRQALPWLGLVLAAGLPRFLGALFLANQDRDANAYVEAIAELRAIMAAGAFSIKDTAGFWLPLYQTICAAVSLLVNNPLYVAKILSAICGTGTCLFVFLICKRMTDRAGLAYAAVALIAFNPLHIMYSSYSMTEVPYSFLVVGSLFFLIEDRSLLAALFGLLAGLMRVEAWMLIILIPALQIWTGRKVSVASSALLLLAPLICFYIYWAATGDPLDYFHSRSDYIRQLLADQPDLRRLGIARVIADAGRLLYSANPLVLIASIPAARIVVRRWRANGRSRLPRPDFAVGASCAFLLSFLAFLLLAYVTNNQPEIWTRYGLLLFAVGAPILIWTAMVLSGRTPKLSREIVLLTVAVCLLQWVLQLRDGIAYAKRAPSRAPVAQNKQPD